MVWRNNKKILCHSSGCDSRKLTTVLCKVPTSVINPFNPADELKSSNITSYMHVCTTAITVQMVVNFIIDLENNVRTKNFRADRIFRNYRSGRTKIFSEHFGPGPNISGPKFQRQILHVCVLLFDDMHTMDRQM